ncbi:helix-turn-helix transcriptional regulator [Actinoplanes friuliensis]|uniref:Helix-turn-helix protein n=1 Tax=Actinoplanes friuliensis DSM 7358 TaxID=1246995 RepID=U5VVH4_9ACTN|nr:helix-turn-helix transcriptional regulator [Actinoplanes friuliensis]AGZ40807.1 Helix-turn-helix protein [Actinoplanes friuliensis DSM 7358]
METDIGAFLRTRRDRITPDQVGLPAGATRRRVPGLRREEVALIAGVSPDYYVRLEQGRTAHVSDQVLCAVARALSLSGAETEHLRNLARLPEPAPSLLQKSATAEDEPLARLLDAITDAPALLVDTRMNILAANAAAEAVFDVSGMAQPPNSARQLFLAREAKARYGNWEAAAEEVVAHLRLMTGRWPDDAPLTALIDELGHHSDDFRRLWARADVGEKRVGTVHVTNHVAGPLEFDYHVLTVPARPDRSLLTYLPRPGSPTQEALRMLLTRIPAIQ